MGDVVLPKAALDAVAYPIACPLLPMQSIEPIDYRINPITGCWIWRWHCDPQGYAIDDYGRLIARQVYREHKGGIPEGYAIGHSCWHPRCVNPEHLEPKPKAEIQPARRTIFLDMEKAREIRAKAAAGARNAVLARDYLVTTTTIRDVVLNITWSDPAYMPRLKYRSRKEANPKTVRRVRALRARGMSYTAIANHIHLKRRKVIAYCSGRYLSPEYNTASEANDVPPAVPSVDKTRRTGYARRA